MKRSNKILLILTLAFFTFMPAQVSALSVAYCQEDTRECRIQNCETDVLVANWPNDTGYTRHCEAEADGFSSKQVMGIGAVVIPLLFLGLAVFYLVHYKSRHTAHRDEDLCRRLKQIT